MTDNALMKLQELVSHQQEDIARLSQELYTQQQEVADLQRLLKQLKKQLELMQAEMLAPAAGQEPPPPHY